MATKVGPEDIHMTKKTADIIDIAAYRAARRKTLLPNVETVAPGLPVVDTDAWYHAAAVSDEKARNQ